MPKVRTQVVEFPSNGDSAPGYLAQPTEGGPYPGLVVIQEWWGLVPHIKEVTGRFAQQGFVAMAPDLYHGEAATEPDEARKLSMAFDRVRAIKEIRAAADYLAAMESVAPKKTGLVGWCMGGGLALSAAAHNGEAIGAVVAFYGRPLEASDTAKLHTPVLGLYGELDKGVPSTLVRDFEKELKKNGVVHEVRIYPDAGHAFFNDSRPQAYHPESAEDAWKRALDWFRRHLQ